MEGWIGPTPWMQFRTHSSCFVWLPTTSHGEKGKTWGVQTPTPWCWRQNPLWYWSSQTNLVLLSRLWPCHQFCFHCWVQRIFDTQDGLRYINKSMGSDLLWQWRRGTDKPFDNNFISISYVPDPVLWPLCSRALSAVRETDGQQLQYREVVAVEARQRSSELLCLWKRFRKSQARVLACTCTCVWV